VVFGGDEAWEDAEAAGFDAEVVVAVVEADAAEFDDGEAAAFEAEVRKGLFEMDHAVDEGVGLEVADLGGGGGVEEEDGASAADEEAFECEELAAVAEGIAGKQADFGKGIDDDAAGIDAFGLGDEGAHDFAEFNFGGVEDVVGLVLAHVFFVATGLDFEDGDAVEGPVVGGGDAFEFFAGFAEGDVEALFADASSFEEELEGEGGFAHAGVALDEIEAVAREPTAENDVEAFDTGANAGGG
jgi:hypothetical protein